MKRAGYLAWLGLAGLLLIAAVFLTGAILYGSNAMWAGMLGALAQALVVGLAGWGLVLARQNAELEGFTAPIGGQMVSAISPESPPLHAPSAPSRPLEMGFQRLVVTIAAVILLAAGIIAGWIVYATIAWAQANPDKPFPVAGKPIDELALVIGLGCAGMYAILYWMTRITRGIRGYGEAVNSNFTIGLPGMIGIGVAIILGYFGYPYASEAAGTFMALLLILQGTELLVNAMRSYSGIEELDQEPVDLDRLPLAPMLSSVWLSSVKMLFAASVGLTDRKRGEKGVIARMMPRVIVAVILIALVMSCIRVVPSGYVAVRERLGYAEGATGADGEWHITDKAILGPGLHFMMPWPIDQLVVIPTEQLQYEGVGADVHEEKAGQAVDFQFWRVRTGGEKEEATEYITGEPDAPQLLETYVAVFWRVKDPVLFYNRLSHSDFYERGDKETLALPIYEALVQQAAEFAVTKTFGAHRLDEIMTTGRHEVEGECKKELQGKLSEVGIEVVDLTIKDVHPPVGLPDQRDETIPALGTDPYINQFVQVQRGPASAYENVMSMREIKEMLITVAEGNRTQQINDATGWGKSEISRAEGYRADKIAKAEGEAARMTSMMGGVENLPADERKLMETLARKQTLYAALKDVLLPVAKVVVDPKVEAPSLYQGSKNQGAPLPMPQ